jgi:outer membrane lipoprotein
MRPFTLRPLLVMSLALWALAGCVAPRPPLPVAGTEPGVTPGAVLARPDAHRGAQVLWGGGIIATENLAAGARIELLAYPLDGQQRPRRGAEPRGRVLVRRDGYLEPMDYHQGRSLTLRGRVVGVRTTRVGERRLEVPVVEAEALHLWPREPAARRGGLPFDIHFGIFVHN